MDSINNELVCDGLQDCHHCTGTMTTAELAWAARKTSSSIQQHPTEMEMLFEWDCDCAWELDVDKWSPPPPPPLFDLPPPPLPPSMSSLKEICSVDTPFLDTCQAFLVSTTLNTHPCSESPTRVPLSLPPCSLYVSS